MGEIISVQVIPSIKESKLGEPYSEDEVHNYTTDINEWVDFKLGFILDDIKKDAIFSIENNIKEKPISFEEIEEFMSFMDFYKKFKHFATGPVFKVGADKVYSVKSYKMSREEIENASVSDNVALYGLSKRLKFGDNSDGEGDFYNVRMGYFV